MSKTAKTPKLRFKGFTDAWEQCELGKDIANIIGGGTPSTTNPEYWNGNIDWYSPSEIGNQVYAIHSNKTITKAGLQSSSAKMLPANKTILFTSRASIGETAILKNPGSTNQGFQSLVVNDNFDVYFIYSSTPLIKQYALEKASGSTFLEISSKLLGQMKMACPGIQEQIQIGRLLKALDTLITLHQRKLKKLKIIKKSLLEKMFPKNGEKIPELRFKGFTDAWEQCELQEISNRYDNLRIPIATQNRIKGSTPYYGANGIQDYVKGYTHDGEFILVAEDGANDLNNYPVQYVNGKIWVNNHAHVLQGKVDLCDTLFLKYALAKMDIGKWLVGGSRAKLNASTMMNLSILVPTQIQEQSCIGKFFYKLDTLITLHQRKLEKLQTIKKSLLEKMFV